MKTPENLIPPNKTRGAGSCASNSSKTHSSNFISEESSAREDSPNSGFNTELGSPDYHKNQSVDIIVH